MRKPWDREAARSAFLLTALLLIGGALLGGVFLGRATKSTKTVAAASTTTSTIPVQGDVAAGAHLFVSFACAQCHGLDGRGGVSPDVPALKNAAKLTPTQLRSILDHGIGASGNPTKPYMPVWGAVLSDHQIKALVAYIRAGLPAVATATPVEVPSGQGLEVEGQALYTRYGCINCHGPNGAGGVPNPLSADKTVPPLSGADFFKQFNTDAKIIDVIRSGSVIGRAPIVSMPHWGGIIPEQQLRALVAYIKTLRRS